MLTMNKLKPSRLLDTPAKLRAYRERMEAATAAQAREDIEARVKSESWARFRLIY